jgi:hypothetical protein
LPGALNFPPRRRAEKVTLRGWAGEVSVGRAPWQAAEMRADRGGWTMAKMNDLLALDLVVAKQCQRHPDFPEGVRALLIDKTRDAVWSPPSFDAVDDTLVDGFFAPLAMA